MLYTFLVRAPLPIGAETPSGTLRRFVRMLVVSTYQARRTADLQDSHNLMVP